MPRERSSRSTSIRRSARGNAPRSSSTPWSAIRPPRTASPSAGDGQRPAARLPGQWRGRGRLPRPSPGRRRGKPARPRPREPRFRADGDLPMSVGVQPVETWHEANQRSLMAAVARVKDALERHVNAGITPWPGDTDHSPNGSEPAASALDRLCAIFGVSPFERDILVLCAGVELDAGVRTTLCRGSGRSRTRLSHLQPGTSGIAGRPLERPRAASAASLLASDRHRPWGLVDAQPVTRRRAHPARPDRRRRSGRAPGRHRPSRVVCRGRPCAGTAGDRGEARRGLATSARIGRSARPPALRSGASQPAGCCRARLRHARSRYSSARRGRRCPRRDRS